MKKNKLKTEICTECENELNEYNSIPQVNICTSCQSKRFKQLEESNKVMNEANIKLPKVVEYIDELKASIKRLTEEKLEMLTDSERETIFTLFHAETMNIKDENIAHHLILLGCVDELPSGEYVLNGEWRKIISEIERKEAK